MQGPSAKLPDCHASWRDVLPIHPAAEMVEAATKEEQRILRGDLKQHGQREPIVLVRIRQGCEQVLDGRTRLDLQEANGDNVIGADGKLTVPHRIIELPDDAAAISYVLSLNLFRRHLTLKQKRKLIEKLLKAMPERSNRQIAQLVDASPTTVGTKRGEMEAKGDVSKLDTSIDTRGRKQPARKGWSTQRWEKHRAKKRRHAAMAAPAAAESGVVETTPTSTTAETTGGGEAPDFARGQRVGAELVGYAESMDITSNTYSALLDAWYRSSADDRCRFLRFIGAQFIDDAVCPAPASGERSDIPNFLQRNFNKGSGA
jgi:DNA-binding Lrp family transcriptional regulator